MPNLYQGIHSLEKSINRFGDFCTLKNEMEIFDAWGDFLIFLNHCWVKTERGFQDIRNQFQPLQGKYIKMRREDPLLSFIKNARDNHEHTITQSIKMEITDERHLYNQHAIIHESDENGDLLPESTKVVHFFASDFVLTDFYINGAQWSIPGSHNGRLLKNIGSPYEVGYLTCCFYINYLIDLDSKFLNSTHKQRLIALLSSKSLSFSRGYNHKRPRFFFSGKMPIAGGKRIHSSWRPGISVEHLRK